MNPVTYGRPSGHALNVTAAARSSNSESGGNPNRAGGGAGRATLVSNPIGSAWIARSTASGRTGVNPIAPAASTPVETVTIAAPA